MSNETESYTEAVYTLLDQLIEVSKKEQRSQHTMMWHLMQACFLDPEALKRLDSVLLSFFRSEYVLQINKRSSN